MEFKGINVAGLLNDTKNIIFGIVIGSLIMIHGICIEKDKTITLVKGYASIKTSSSSTQSEIPKNLPLITMK